MIKEVATVKVVNDKVQTLWGLESIMKLHNKRMLHFS